MLELVSLKLLWIGTNKVGSVPIIVSYPLTIGGFI